MLAFVLVVTVCIAGANTQKCEDKKDARTCNAWKDFSYCKELLNKPEHYNFMKANCTRTCGFCEMSDTKNNDINSDCTDKLGEEKCTQWATQTVCEPGHMYYHVMESYCSLTCELCTVQSLWTAWSPWTNCSTSCGKEGQQTRHRACKSMKDGSIKTHCIGMTIDQRSCNDDNC